MTVLLNDIGGMPDSQPAIAFDLAKVAAARKLAVRLYWMLRTRKPYPEIAHEKVVRIESSSRVPLVGASETVMVDWALSHPAEAGCSHRRIMVAV